MEKKVDSEWKQRADEEKKKIVDEQKQENSSSSEPPANFLTFISGLAAQSMMFLGLMENPLTKKVERDLPQARYFIDTLAMLEEKTKGNLDEVEAKSLKEYLHQLRMGFVAVSKEDEKKE